MRFNALMIAFVSGIATFLLVGVAVTALTERWIEFSLLVGIPIGLVVGALAAGGVYLGLSEGPTAQRRRIANSFGSFAVVFLGVLLVAAGLFAVPVTYSILAGAVLGSLAAIGTYVQRQRVSSSA